MVISPAGTFMPLQVRWSELFIALLNNNCTRDSAGHHAAVVGKKRNKWKWPRTERQLRVLTMAREADIVVLHFSSLIKVYFAVRTEWWRPCLWTILWIVPDCFIAQIISDFTMAIPMDQVLQENSVGSFPLVMSRSMKVDMIVWVMMISLHCVLNMIRMYAIGLSSIS